jgi:hypothetical protein
VKKCKVCGEEKSLDDFYRNKLGRDGLRPECKQCNLAARARKYAQDPRPYIARVQKWREQNPERFAEYSRRYRQRPERKASERNAYLLRKYGLSLDDYECMLEAQGGVCAICGEARPEERTLHVDHDHVTGAIRGLLCIRCNNAIGNFREEYELFLRAAEYLDRDDELAGLARERVGALSA